jgi:uncharacterized protein YcbK (DUF882 family)
MKPPLNHRRHFLRQGGRLAAAAVALPALAGRVQASVWPGAGDSRALALKHLHTHERIEIEYAQPAGYLQPALQALNHFLRDHYSGEVGRIDPQLFDLMHRVQHTLGSRVAYEIISGYRCPTTNRHLKQTRGGGVASRSLHMDGRAVDVRLPGVPLAELRDAALSLKLGGVGYYPNEQFVHLDTGRTRAW